MNQLTQKMLAEMPALKDFSLLISGKRSMAEDIAQETLLKAWSNLAFCSPDINMRALLFTIARKLHYSHLKDNAKLVYNSALAYDESRSDGWLVISGSQESALRLAELKKNLKRLSFSKREIFAVACVEGYSIEETAAIFGSSKSAVSHRLAVIRRELDAATNAPLPEGRPKPVSKYTSQWKRGCAIALRGLRVAGGFSADEVSSRMTNVSARSYMELEGSRCMGKMEHLFLVAGNALLDITSDRGDLTPQREKLDALML